MKTEDSLGPVQLKDDEDDENKNSQNKEALEASNITIQDISNFWSKWDLNLGIPDFQVPGSHHWAHCLYGHSSWTQANNKRVLCKIEETLISLVFLRGTLRKSRKMGWRNNLLLEEHTHIDTPSLPFQWKTQVSWDAADDIVAAFVTKTLGFIMRRQSWLVQETSGAAAPSACFMCAVFSEISPVFQKIIYSITCRVNLGKHCVLRRLERVFLVAIVFVKRWKIPKKDIS